MSPLNDFYTHRDWLVNDGSLNCVVSFNAAHPIFLGHFPGNPIVPGVTTMELMMDLLQQALAKKLELRSAHTIKFLQLITPAIHPAVHISWTETDGTYMANAILKDGAATLFKMNGVYAIKA